MGASTASKRRRRLGQHWLVDRRYLLKIAQALAPAEDETVIEVGAGPGNLTEVLIPRVRRLVAVEVDERWASALEGRFSHIPHVRIVKGDILRLPLSQLLNVSDGGPPYVVVGNLPFSIGTAIVRRFLHESPPPRRLVVTLQLEVARRMTAPPGRMTYLAVETQLKADASLLFAIPSRAFHPPPQVRAAVVRLATRSAPPISLDDEQFFLRVVKAGFVAPRKHLRNSLALGLGCSPGGAEELLQEAEIAPYLRPGQLTLEGWARLYQVIRTKGMGHGLAA